MPEREPSAIEKWQALTQRLPRGAAAYPQGGEEVVKLLAGIGDLLAGILAELREQVPQGVVYTLDNLVIPANTLVPEEIFFDPPLFNLSIINSGGAGGTVQYRIPDRSDAVWTDLNINEQEQFNAIKGVFTSMAFRNVTVTAANIRLRGIY